MRETLGVLLGFFLAAVLGYLISEVAQKEQEKEVLESYMDSLQEIYEVIRQRMDVTRKFRHDLLSHVQTLEYLIEKQKNPDGELRKYADQLTETYRKIQKGTFCRDEITDAFLMMEKQVCIEKEIPFQIQVSKTCMEWMMPVERIGFLHNLLDNAIEANGRIPEKERKELSFWIEEDSDSCTVKLRNALASKEVFNLSTINEQISNFAQTYPTNLKASSNEALLFMRRYRFANCSCFSCCFKDAYPSSNVQ